MGEPRLTFLHGRHTVRCDSRVDKHFVGYHALQLMTAGSVELFYDDEHHVLTKPTWWLASPGPHIRFHPAPGHKWWEHRYIAIRGPQIKQWQEMGIWPGRVQPASDPVGGAEQLDVLYELLARDDALAHHHAVHQVQGILIDLAEQRRAAADEPAWLVEARALLQQQSSFEPDYQAIADQLEMGLSTLRRRFRAATGNTLHEFVMRQRITKAQRQLVDTDDPIKEIARDLGYRDVFYFARQFAKVAGVPPAAYRKSRQH